MDFNNSKSKKKLDSKKLNKILLILFSIIFMIIIFQGRTFFNMTNSRILLLLSLIARSIFPTLLFGFLVISLLPIIILRKSNEVKLTAKHRPIIVIIIIVIFAFCLNYIAMLPYGKYTIHSRKVYGIEMAFRTLGDMISNKTIEIKSENCKVRTIKRSYTPRKTTGWYSTSGTRQTIYDYYLEIDEGKYIIPIGSATKVKALLYQNSYGQKSINTITVYKNSKIIKEINGVDLSAESHEIYEFANNKQYKINIVLQPNQTISYQTVGCTLDEFISNNDVLLYIFDKNDKVVSMREIKEGVDNLPVDLDNGKYSAYICTFFMNLEKISNSIIYEIKDGKIYKAEQQD